MIEIIKTYVQEEADYDIDTLLYKVQSKMISNEKISVSPKFIFTFILKHYQHFIGRNDIFKCGSQSYDEHVIAFILTVS